jgi:hypothetical protein
MEIGSRRILYCNVTEDPTAVWTIQQFREFLAFDHPYRFVVHDRDGIFSRRLDQELSGFGVRADTLDELFRPAAHKIRRLNDTPFGRTWHRTEDV